MRSDLQAVDGVTHIETDLDEQTCSFKLDESTDVEELLNSLAEKNDKMSEWTFITGRF